MDLIEYLKIVYEFFPLLSLGSVIKADLPKAENTYPMD